MPDDELAALAARHHRVVSREQAVTTLGFDALGRRLKTGEMRRYGDGAFHFRGASPDWKGVLQAALFDAGAASAVSHGSAARLHRFPSYGGAPPEILVPAGLDHRCRIAVVHESRRFEEVPTTEVDRLRATTPEATLLLLAGRLRVHRLAWLTDELVAGSRVDIAELERLRRLLMGRGVPGSAAMKALVADRLPGAPITESRLERMFLQMCQQFALPVPTWQAPFPGWDHVGGRVDGCYGTERLIVEVDGRRWHTRVADFERDHRRDLEASALGYRVARITYLMLRYDTSYVAAQLERALRRAAA